MLAGHHVTRVEKKVYTSFEPAHGYDHVPADGYAEEPAHEGYDHKPESYEHAKPVYKTVQRCVPKVGQSTPNEW